MATDAINQGLVRMPAPVPAAPPPEQRSDATPRSPPNAANSSLAPRSDAHARLRRSCGGYDAAAWRSDRTLARSPTTEDARWLLRHVSTGLGDLAILNRGCAGGTNGPDNLAIRDERNAALQRRGSA